jgi:glycosyltransferase involved in cell wall biosynthesis
MTAPPMVSAITIFLNEQAYILEAIESVIAQSYDSWELLLVDDGSSDGSTDIAKQYASKCPDRIHYLEHPGHQNRGMSASRNLGLIRARGNLVALLDADDVWLPGKLAVQQALLSDQPRAEMVYDATRMWHSWSGDPEAVREERLRELGSLAGILVEPPKMIPHFLRGDAETPGTCSMLFRRRVIDKIGGFEEPFRGMFEDQVFLYKLCLHFPMFLAEGSTALYRQHSASCCHVAQRNGHYDPSGPSDSRRAFLEWLGRYLRQHVSIRDQILPILEEELRVYRQGDPCHLALEPHAIEPKTHSI